MKKLFLLLFLILTAAALYTIYSSPEDEAGRPVLSWRSDPNPQRYDQIDHFHNWLLENGHTAPDGGPVAKLVLDSASNQSTLIQAVSGMAGDFFDTGDVPGYQQLGVGIDITEQAAAEGYGFQNTYANVGELISMDGRQYAYPCNAAVYCMWVNLDTMRRYGMEAPPLEWTPEEFERIGKEFVRRANEGEPRQIRFFCSGFENIFGVQMLTSLIRSQGLDMFNETYTRCVANDPRLVNALRLFYKWTYEDRLVPTAADVASMNTSSGYGGGDFSNFMDGKYAMIPMGRYCLIRFREFSRPINFHLSMYPMYEFKNLPMTVRAAMPYAGSKHPELIGLFMQYLASKEYNMLILEGADGLPPNPDTIREELTQIKYKYPNEGTVHEQELAWGESIAIGQWLGPYVKAGASDWLRNGMSRYFNGLMTVEEAVADIEQRYNMEVETSKEANPAVRAQWEEAWAIQQKIDEYKKEGRKIPAEWISNTFYREYYRSKGMLEEEE